MDLGGWPPYHMHRCGLLKRDGCSIVYFNHHRPRFHIAQMKVPRRIVAIEIRQGTFQISRKINFSIGCGDGDQIFPTLDYFQRTRIVRIRIRAYLEIVIPSSFRTPIPQATELFSQPVIAGFLWLVESALISSAG